MFGAIGTFVYRMRFAVIAVMIVLMGGLGLYGLGLGKNLSQSGFFDDGSQSVKGSQLADTTFGRDHKSDIVLLITPPSGTKVDDAAFGTKVEKFVDEMIRDHSDVVDRNDPGIIDPFAPATSTAAKAAQDQIRAQTFDASRDHAFISIGVRGDDDTTVLNNYKKLEPAFDNIDGRYDLPGAKFQLAGLQPIANAISNGTAEDTTRAEVIALPLVALMLFFIFGGVVAAVLPVVIGGLTIAGATGILNALAQTTEVNFFAQPVISLIGLGIAIDYGLFIVSRFREELAEGYPPKLAVRRTVMTAGQTVVFSATIIVAALACLLIFPQGFLKSVAYGAICAVSLAALLSVTVLPGILGILGTRIDMLGFKFLRRTKTKKEIEDGFWGKLAGWVMRHPLKTAIPTVLLLLVLIIPFSNISFGGITEKYLPPGNDFRSAQQDFDRIFPTQRTEDIKLVIPYDENSNDDGTKLQTIADEANKIPGFTKQFSLDSAQGAQTGSIEGTNTGVVQMSAGLIDRNTAGDAVKALRAIDTQGLTMYVAGTPALTQDSIDALLDDLPLMAVMLIVVTFLLMFLQFGSVVLPIKAALMSALGLGSTLGVLTWIFIDGHGSSLFNFTPGPLMSAVLVLIIAIIYGLSTDYEVFLLSRMVEARQKGATTTEAIRSGTAHTGRIITAAAAILVVVVGAFGFSEIVMMKYIAFGIIAALILDATVIRMLLVPAIMKLLGDDCWWAPKWMQAVQRKIGLGETILDDEPGRATIPGSSRDAGTVVAQVPTMAMAAAGSGRGAGTRPAAPRPAGPERVTPDRVPPRDGRPLPPRPAVGRGGPPSRDQSPHDGPVRPKVRRVDADAPVGPRRPPPPPDSGPIAPPRPSRETTTSTRPPAPAGTGSPRGRANSSRPDTGGWSLGDSGIRLGGAISARPPSGGDQPRSNGSSAVSNGAPASAGPATGRGPEPMPVRGGRPVPPERTGARPPAAPSGSDDRGPLGRRPSLQDQRNDRPLIASLSPEDDSRDDPSDDRTDDHDSSGRRHERGDDRQISVQELLRRRNNNGE
ncbi:MMPL family transporter [Williamsia maris]|uniref:Drug exporter of the RND superfamily n=1 Tax=Williamsia maris TaxID=72806 RepID=A0ABT1HDN6_9NOCA|nr:MMPL family transporter [Williamsia maris]MCP2176368.1 putative drug exporter of the RND superfamily [Williamsia maris]